MTEREGDVPSVLLAAHPEVPYRFAPSLEISIPIARPVNFTKTSCRNPLFHGKRSNL